MPHDATVSVLIDNENKWKTDMIQRMFQKKDADAILSIQLPKRQRKNEVMIEKGHIQWKVDPSGAKYKIPRFTKMLWQQK